MLRGVSNRKLMQPFKVRVVSGFLFERLIFYHRYCLLWSNIVEEELADLDKFLCSESSKSFPKKLRLSRYTVVKLKARASYFGLDGEK